MNRLVLRYFQEDPNFEDALILGEQSKKSWEACAALCPSLPRSWFELSCLPVEDRIDFTRQFWLRNLPFHPLLYKGIDRFFDRLDDVAPVLLLDKGWSARLLYSLRDGSTFFCGHPPANTSDLIQLEERLPFPFPASWKAFMKIHNGFGKLLDTGILSIDEVEKKRVHILQMAMRNTIHSAEKRVDPEILFPFYEVSGLNSFHCFLAGWFPEGEMGTVYFSGIDYTISDTGVRRSRETGATARFGDWLISFLEGTEMVP